MRSLKTTTGITVYEVDGKDALPSLPDLKISSHWNWGESVVIETPDGKKYTVIAEELKRAIENAKY
jgi:hypothetical protein